MGASTCVSCGNSMFAPPGVGGATRRLASTPAPWQDDGANESGIVEHHRLGSAADAHAADTHRLGDAQSVEGTQGVESAAGLEAQSGRLALADDRPGSGTHDLHVEHEAGSLSFESLVPSGDDLDSGGRSCELVLDSDTASRPFPATSETESSPDLSAALPPALPDPVSLPKRQGGSLCDICFGPAPNAMTGMCAECEIRAGVSADGGTGTARVRPRPIKRRKSAARRGLAVAVVGGLLVAAGFGVLDYVKRPRPGSGLLKNAVAKSVVVRLAIPDVGSTHFETTIDVRLLRENRRSQLASSLSRVFDVQQVSNYAASVTLDEAQESGATIVVRSVSTLASQDGEHVTRDGGIQRIYRWDGDVAVSNLLVPSRGPIAAADGSEPTPAHDVPPFLVFGTTGAPAGALEPGAVWRADVRLPCVARPDGSLAAQPFTCSFEFVGRRVVDARDCAVVRVKAVANAVLGSGFERFDAASGTVAGALAFDVETGLLVRAELDVDTRVSRGERDDPDDIVRVQGTIAIARASR